MKLDGGLGNAQLEEAPGVVLLAVEPSDAQRAFRVPELPARGPSLGEGVEDGDDLTQRPTEPGELADDQTVASIKSPMRKSCLRAYSRMSRRWLRTSCCAVETLK